jgi:hypothetical protein
MAAKKNPVPERAIQWRDTHQNSINPPAIVYELDTGGSPVTMIHLKHESKKQDCLYIVRIYDSLPRND